MWECKTGADGAPSGVRSLSRHGSVATDDVTAGTKTFGSKPGGSGNDVKLTPSVRPVKPPKPITKKRPVRSDYVEVWQCNTGNHQVGDDVTSILFSQRILSMSC